MFPGHRKEENKCMIQEKLKKSDYGFIGKDYRPVKQICMSIESIRNNNNS